MLILDEPTTGVDAVSRKEFWEMLKKLKNKGITILVSTPYMDEATLCDRVALIQKGNILQINTPQQIISQFDTKLYAVKAKNIYKLLVDLRNYPNTNSVFPFGQYLHYTDKNEQADIEKITSYLKEKNNKDIEIIEAEPGIEDCFMALMGNM